MRFRTGLAGVLVLLSTGCGGQAIYNQEVALAKDDIRPITVGPFTEEQSITVSVASSGAPVSVYVCDSEQLVSVDYALHKGEKPANVLAGEASTESATLTALAPPNKEIVIRLEPVDKPATVQLKITK